MNLRERFLKAENQVDAELVKRRAFLKLFEEHYPEEYKKLTRNLFDVMEMCHSLQKYYPAITLKLLAQIEAEVQEEQSDRLTFREAQALLRAAKTRHYPVYRRATKGNIFGFMKDPASVKEGCDKLKRAAPTTFARLLQEIRTKQNQQIEEPEMKESTNKTEKLVETVRTDYKAYLVVYGVKTPEEITEAGIDLDSHTYKAKITETYATGDVVLVPSRNSFSIATIVKETSLDEILSNDDLVYKWVVGSVDFTNYSKTLEQDAQIAKSIRSAELLQKRKVAQQILEESLDSETYQALLGDVQKVLE